jgi:pimeloyl-ACP methyl ester carboxylesterase
LFFRDWGAGTPIVFAAPWALSCDWWEYQMAHLASQGLRCVAYDRRGQDRSDEARGGFDFDTLADDLRSVLEQLDLHNVILVGQSMGAGEAVRYVARHNAARIAKLVLIAPITPSVLKSPTNPSGVDPDFLVKVRAALSSDRPGVISGAAPAFFGAPENTVSPEMMQWWVRMLLRCPLHTMLQLHHSFTETDFSPDVASIKLPTLIIQGDKDTSTPLEATGRPTAKMISQSRLEVYEGAAHGLPITHMDRLNRDLLAFARAS